MRLLNVSTRKLEEFQGPRPRYAILSHTWGKEEVTFEDLKTSDYTEKLGYKKIDGCCKQAQKARIEYVWIDTCCINKSSSAELSEAINSMFEWYARSRVCYIYLSDVPPASLDEHKKPGSLFRSSRWFTRGWTLQELLAPKNRMLFDSSWQQVKFDIEDRIRYDGRDLGYGSRYLEEERILSEITDIRIECLQTIANRSRRLRTPLHEFSVSERMSWASRRKTTREEDVAYCLLGIFGVNMPLLYGEGKRAFHRLQEEIIRMTPDETILCWGLGRADQRSMEKPIGALAQSPRAFAKVGGLINGRKEGTTGDNTGRTCRYEGSQRSQMASHSIVTSRGILIGLPLDFIDGSNGLALGILDVYLRRLDQRVALPLVRANHLYSNVFTTAPGCNPFILPKDYRPPSSSTTIYLQHHTTTEWEISTCLPHDHMVEWRIEGVGAAWGDDGWQCRGWYPPIPLSVLNGFNNRHGGSKVLPPHFLMIYANKTGSILCRLETTKDGPSFRVKLEVAVISEPVSTPLDILYDQTSEQVETSRLERFHWSETGIVSIGNRAVRGVVHRIGWGKPRFIFQLSMT